jgi:hypothetical protein
MFEFIVMFIVCMTMVKVAMVDYRSPAVWGGITFVFCLVSMLLIPFPLIRLGIALLASAALMLTTKIGKE